MAACGLLFIQYPLFIDGIKMQFEIVNLLKKSRPVLQGQPGQSCNRSIIIWH